MRSIPAVLIRAGEFWLWAWDAAAGKAIIIADWDSTSIANNTVEDPLTIVDQDTMTVTEELEVPWWTNQVQNGTYVMKSALKCSNALDPNNPKHTGDPPPDEFTDGTAGGATLSVNVKNVVITNYYAAPTDTITRRGTKSGEWILRHSCFSHHEGHQEHEAARE